MVASIERVMNSWYCVARVQPSHAAGYIQSHSPYLIQSLTARNERSVVCNSEVFVHTILRMYSC